MKKYRPNSNFLLLEMKPQKLPPGGTVYPYEKVYYLAVGLIKLTLTKHYCFLFKTGLSLYEVIRPYYTRH